MPCSCCRAWIPHPSWHRCEARCVDHEGKVFFYEGVEIKCSRSWDDTYWFFFCDRCKRSRPRIIGALRGLRIYHSSFMDRLEMTSDSEQGSSSSEGIPITQEEAEEDYIETQAAKTEALKNKAAKSLSIRRITEWVGTYLTGKMEIMLFRTCQQIYLGNRARGNWWANMMSDGPTTRFVRRNWLRRHNYGYKSGTG